MRASRSSFLGRQREIAAVQTLLDDARLVTLTGPPGVGKSRLALEVANSVSDLERRAVLVELADSSEPSLVPHAVASALSVQEVAGHSVRDAVTACLRRRRVLLVLDNCEHLLGACGELVDALLRDCPPLMVVATSREPLGVACERVWQVPPLSLPASGEPVLPATLEHSDAVRLFVERARAVRPSFNLNPYVARDVAEICTRLDGIALAIELAGARVEVFTPAEIARRLDDRFALLSTADQAEPPRHRTLEAALDWSHELLTAGERALLRRLSVFAGRFSPEAVEAICAGADVRRADVMALLERLASRSLLVVDVDPESGARYRLLETIRAYAAARLVTAGEAAALREAHARFYLALAEEAEPRLEGPAQVAWLERLDSERANLRAAVEWSLGHGRSDLGLRLAGALVVFWRVRSHFSEGRDLLAAALAASDRDLAAHRAKALWGAGVLTSMTGDFWRALPLLEESLAGFEQLGDAKGCARALLLIASCKQLSMDPDVLSLLEESSSLAERVGDSWCLAYVHGVAGGEHSRRRNLPAARAGFDRCVAVARSIENPHALYYGLSGLASVEVGQGDHAPAEALLEEAAVLAAELGDGFGRAMVERWLGELAMRRGAHDRARGLLESACSAHADSFPHLAIALALLARLAHVQDDLAGARSLFERALRVGDGTPSPSVQCWLGELVLDEGDAPRARRWFEDARDYAVVLGDQASMAQALAGLGRMARMDDDRARAAALHNEALEVRRLVEDAPGIVASLEAVAGLAAAERRHRRAARLLAAGQALRELRGYARTPWEAESYEADLAMVREGLTADVFQRTWAQGGALTLEAATASATNGNGTRPSSGWSGLTARERQVAELVGQGLTNREIAGRLVISRGTAKNHLAHVYAKLGITRRSDLVRELARRGK